MIQAHDEGTQQEPRTTSGISDARGAAQISSYKRSTSSGTQRSRGGPLRQNSPAAVACVGVYRLSSSGQLVGHTPIAVLGKGKGKEQGAVMAMDDDSRAARFTVELGCETGCPLSPGHAALEPKAQPIVIRLVDGTRVYRLHASRRPGACE